MLDLSAPPPAELHNTPRELVIKDGRGRPLGGDAAPVTLLVVGCYSDAYVSTQRAVAVQALLRSPKSSEDAMAERLRKFDVGLDILVACVTDWRNVAENGLPAKCTPDKVRTLLKGYPFAREQLELFIHADRNFTQGGLPSSSTGPVSSSPSTTPTP
jgi:hypothetical protein